MIYPIWNALYLTKWPNPFFGWHTDCGSTDMLIQNLPLNLYPLNLIMPHVLMFWGERSFLMRKELFKYMAITLKSPLHVSTVLKVFSHTFFYLCFTRMNTIILQIRSGIRLHDLPNLTKLYKEITSNQDLPNLKRVIS